MPPAFLLLSRPLRCGDLFASNVSAFFQNFIHATRIDAIVGSNIGLNLSVLVSKPNVNSFVESELSFTHYFFLSRIAS